MIYINGDPLESISNLDTKHQLILSLISNGKEWLKWAIKDTNIPDVRVESERQLLEAVQSGLHNDQYIRFKTFRAVLAKFMDMSEDDLEAFSVAAYGKGDNESVPQEVLKANQILCYKDLADSVAYASSMVAQAPVLFSDPSFSDLLDLAPFVEHADKMDKKLRKGAELFAQVEASSIAEFIDLFNFFVAASGKQIKNGGGPALQLSVVKQVYDHLLPLLNGLIFTPNIGKVTGMSEMRKLIVPVVGANKFVGYETKQSAAANLADNITFGKLDETELRMNIEKYLLEIKNIICLAKTPAGVLRQDGKYTTLHYRQNKTNINLGVDQSGNVVLLAHTQLKTSS